MPTKNMIAEAAPKKVSPTATKKKTAKPKAVAKLADPDGSLESVPAFTLKLVRLKLSQITDHPINPSMRPKRVEDLKKDKLICAGTLVNPLKVVKEGDSYVLLDGHRRKAVMIDKHGKNHEIDCIVYSITSKNESDKATIYASLNTAQKHKGDEKAAIFLVDPSYLSESDIKQHVAAEKGLTTERFKRCIGKEISPTSLWRDIKTTAGRCRPKKGKAKFQEKLVEWMFSEKDEIRNAALRSFKAEWTLKQHIPKMKSNLVDELVMKVEGDAE